MKQDSTTTCNCGGFTSDLKNFLPLPVEADGSIRVSFADKELLFAGEQNAPEQGWHCLHLAHEEVISRAKILTFLENYNKVALISPDAGWLFDEFAAQFVWVEAAGGVVERDGGEVVMISRNGRWDLPKGHREEGESFEQCAAREAQEETSVEVESVGRLLCSTLHCYNLYGKWEMKFTAWYAMRAKAQSQLAPQREEGIVSAVWVEKSQVEERIKDSFPTIKRVFDAFLA